MSVRRWITEQENGEFSLMGLTGTCVALWTCGGNTGAMEWDITPWRRTKWTKTWSEMMLWKCDLKWLEMGGVVGVVGLVKRWCEGAGCKLCLAHVPNQYHLCGVAWVSRCQLWLLSSPAPHCLVGVTHFSSVGLCAVSLQDCAPQWGGLCPLQYFST